MILFYGSCSSDRPCVGRELVPWTRGVSDKRFGQEGEIDVEHYDTDLVLTIADTESTSEKYTVYADGKEIGSTLGRLTLGKDKYKRDHTNRVNVGSGAAGALRSIANDGVWGSFKIPRGMRLREYFIGNCRLTISSQELGRLPSAMRTLIMTLPLSTVLMNHVPVGAIRLRRMLFCRR